jgi:RND family efflux transporter MFP subunit
MSHSAAQTWLEDKVAERSDVSSAILMLEKNGALAEAAAWPREQVSEPSLAMIAREAFRTNESVTWEDTENTPYAGPERRVNRRLYSRPILRNGKRVGAMALVMSDADENANNDVARAATTTQAPIAPISPMLTMHQSNKNNNNLSESKALNILNVVATALGKDKFDEAIADVATELATAFECDRVSIGLMKGRFNEVLAVSHSADIQPTPSLLQLLSAAMDEAVDQCATVHYPPLPHHNDQITLSHAELANRHNIQQILTVVMMRDQIIVGAVLLERRDFLPFSAEHIELLENLTATVGPVLELKKDREHSWFSRLKSDIRLSGQKMFTREGRWMRFAVLAILALLIAAPLIPLHYKLNAPARLEGISQRVMVAPTDGFLRSVNVRPGDMVKAGQALAEMADEDLRQERRRWEGEVLRHDSTFGDALKRKDRAQLATAQAQASEARAQLNLAEQQIERTRLVAPFDGVVLKGDLKQQIGAPFKRGDTLMVLAPANEYRIIISVEDRAIDTVKKGAKGQLLLTAMPDTPFELTVERILPVANAQDGRNAFEVEAKLTHPMDALRPGMEGVAKISAGEKSIYWMLGHKTLDSLKLWFWSWTH